MTNNDYDPEETKVLKPNEARQGRPTFALRILIVSTVGIVLVFLLMYFFARANGG